MNACQASEPFSVVVLACVELAGSYTRHPLRVLGRRSRSVRSKATHSLRNIDRIYTGFVPPYSLQRILAALAETSPNARATAYLWTFVFFLSNLSFAQVDVLQRWHTRRCYERTRGQLFCALHYKALKRRDITSQTKQKPEDGKEDEKAGADLGKIVNLMQYVPFTYLYAYGHS